MRRAESGGVSWVVFNDGGTYVAARDVCPHKGAPLSAGEFEDGVVVCPLHGWEFDVRTGESLSMPEWPGLTLRPVVTEGEMLFVEYAAVDQDERDGRTASSPDPETTSVEP